MHDRHPAHLARAWLLATLVGVATLAAAASARAGTVSFWVCHGPAGQPLGSGPLAPSAAADGVTGAYGGGCAAPANGVGDGGLSATFTRPDPVAGSSAAWILGIPANVSLTSVGISRATIGFGAAPLPGDPLVYSTRTSTGTLESASLGDASDIALAGSASFDPASGASVSFGVSCPVGVVLRCAAPPAGTPGIDVSALVVAVSDIAPPKGAVGGVQSPVSGVENLTLLASDDGVGLASATATLDGAPVANAVLGGPSCARLSSSATEIDLPLGADCPATVKSAPLAFDTSAVGDGPHQLTVTVSDASANATTVVDQTITVRNHPPAQSATLSLGLGTGPSAPTPESAGAPSRVAGAAGAAVARLPACVSPELSARMQSRPLRRSPHGVPVVIRATPILFVGRLTCLHGKRRVSATSGTVVDVLRKIGKRTLRLAGVRVAASGFRVVLRLSSSRTIFFRYGSGASLRQVRIPVIVAPAPAKRAASRK